MHGLAWPSTVIRGPHQLGDQARQVPPVRFEAEPGEPEPYVDDETMISVLQCVVFLSSARAGPARAPNPPRLLRFSLWVRARSLAGPIMSLSSDLPEDLKPISAFLKRAEELDGRDPVMAYYCK